MVVKFLLTGASYFWLVKLGLNKIFCIVCFPVVMLKVSIWYRYVSILVGIEIYRYVSNGVDKVSILY